MRKLEKTKIEILTALKQLENKSSLQVGVRLIHMLLVDIIGRDTFEGKLLRHNLNLHSSDIFLSDTNAFIKYMAVCLQIGTVFFMLYYIFVSLEQRKSSFILQVVVCFAAELLLEILVYSVVTCTLIDFVLPQMMIVKKMRLAQNKLNDLLVSIVSTNNIGHHDSLKCSNYFLPSFGVAEMFPNLLGE